MKKNISILNSIKMQITNSTFNKLTDFRKLK